MLNKEQNQSSLQPLWQRIDRIYCISLEDRTDRQAGARDQFARVGLAEQVAFFLARRHSSDCEQGIFESHQTCLNMGLESGARHILVFEDDIVFKKIDPHRLATGIEFFIHTDDCQVLFLGCLATASRATQTAGIRRIQYRCLTHAYLVKRSMARQVVDVRWKKVPYDIMLHRLIEKPFALYPSIAFQSNSPSDNSRHPTLDTVRRLFGGLKLIQTVNEHYQRFRYAAIAAHLLIIGAMILWILF